MIIKFILNGKVALCLLSFLLIGALFAPTSASAKTAMQPQLLRSEAHGNVRANPGAVSLRATFDDGYTSDLSNVLTAVNVMDAQGNAVSNNNYVKGTDYIINLSFQENSAYQFQYNGNGVLTYQLPPQILIKSAIVDKPIYAAAPNDDKVLGLYSIDTNGLITVTFNDVDNNGAPTPGTVFFDNYIDTFFNLSFAVQFTGSDSQIVFNDKITMPVEITDEPVNSTMSITKTASPIVWNVAGSRYDFQTNVNKSYDVTYTSVITSTSGTVNNPTFHDDAMGFSWVPNDLANPWFKSVQVSIPGVNGGAPVTYTLATAAQGTTTPGTYYWAPATKGTYSDPVFTDPNAGFYVVFPTGTTLPQGQSITVTYVIDYNQMMLAGGNDPYHINYGYYLNNTAYASGKDGAGNDLDVNAKLQIMMPPRNYTNKSGTLSADGKTVAWEASAGDGIELLTGKTLYDNLGYYYNTVDNSTSFASPITVKLYAADHTTQIGSTITLTQPTAQNFSYLVSTPNVYYADFTYTVNVNDLTATIYYNNFSFVVNGKNLGYTGGVSNTNINMGVSKTAVVTTVDVGGVSTKAIQWTLNWSVSAPYYGRSAYIYDFLQGAASGYTNIPYGMTVTVNGSNIPANDPANGWFWIMDTGTSNQLRWYFYFSPGGVNPGIPHTSNVYAPKQDVESLFPFQGNTNVIITYYTLLEGSQASTLTANGQNGNTYGKIGDPLLNALMDPTLTGYPIDVENQCDYSGWINGNSKTGNGWTGAYTPISKTGTPGGGGKYVDYKVSIFSRHPYYANSSYATTLPSTYGIGDDPVFTDIFDATTLKYALNSFYVCANGAYYGLYDATTQADLLNNYITYSPDGKTATITIHLSALKQITGTGLTATNTTPGAVTVATVATPTVSQWWKAANTPSVLVYYRLAMQDGVTGIHDVTNTATINTYSATNTSTVGADVVAKTMTKDDTAGNVVNAVININPTGTIIAPDSQDGLYEVTDSMSVELTLYLTSIKVQYQDTPGGAWQDATLSSTYGAAWSYTFSDANNTLKFMFPDGKPIKISYSMKVAGNVGDVVDVSNTVDVAYKFKASASNPSFTVTGINADAGGSKLPVTLFKRDAVHSDIALEGAKFALYMNVYYPGLPNTPPSGVAGTMTMGGQTFYYITGGTTDSNGQLVFDDPNLSYSTGAVYAAVEVQAPANYLLPSDPVTLFCLQNKDFSAFAPKTVQVISDYINVTNYTIKAKDDSAQTKPNTSVNIDVTNNDELLPDPSNPSVSQVPNVILTGSPNELSTNPLEKPSHGKVTVVFKDKNGNPTTMPQVQYTPDAGFEGIDEFEYEIWYPDPNDPTKDPTKGLRSRAKVYVLVLDDDRITCDDYEPIQLSMLTGATYAWYNDVTGDTVVTGIDNPGVQRDDVNHYVDQWIEVNYDPQNTGTSVFPDRVKVRVRFVPKAMKWNPAPGSQDYNDPANWTNWTSPNGNTSAAFSDTLGFVPWGCTDVLIPDLRNTYPDLTNGITSRAINNGNSGEPVCWDIWFEHGGEIAHPDLLNYHWANVELNVNANQWYMFSAPLRNFYTGDIYLTEPCPFNDGVVIWTQLYNRPNPEGRGDGGISWTSNFNTADHLMAAGEGVSIWADVAGTDFDYNDNVLIPEKYWNQQPYTCFESKSGFWFPKPDPMYYYYIQGTNTIATDYAPATDIDRTYFHRFIFESCSKDASTGDITVPVAPAVSDSDMIIVGNPFMSHLDFDKFLAANKDKIQPEYKIITGPADPALEGDFPTFKTYDGTPGAVVDPDRLGNLIAPMQSIILTAKAAFTDLTFNGNMTVNNPGNKLKLSSLPEFVTITASMGDQTNTASLLYSPGASNNFVPGEDSYKLYTENIKDTVSNTIPLVLYTSSSDGFPLEVNTFGNTDENIKLGIRTSLTGNIELDFSGIGSFLSDKDVFLRDRENGTVTNLKEKPFYTFTKETADVDLKDRFLLVFSSATGLGNTQQGNAIVIYADGNHLQVVSNNDLLKSVQVFDLQGRILQGTSPMSRTYTTTINHQGVYVIKAQSETISEVKEIIIGQ